ncbi:MAG: hypothetical protein Tsb002_10620 [Wenzhouxiangellaceae bacterium]
MKRYCLSMVPLLVLLCASGESHGADQLLNLAGPYLGQKPPGLTPELFAPGIVSTENLEIEGVFAPGMNAFYFVRQINRDPVKTYAIRNSEKGWYLASVEPRTGEIGFSIEGRTMYLGNMYRERMTSGWSEAKSLGPLFESFPVMRLTASAAGTYVFDERDEIGTIRYSHLINGKREAPQAFGKEINSGKWTAHPFIAPDESYLIWDSERDGGYGNSDLYISFRQDDGDWGPAINMGAEINTEHDDAYGSVTPDGKYFFFHRVNLNEGFANIYWVDARVIDNLKH